MVFEMDMSGEEGSGGRFKLIPEGWHPAEITNGEVKYSFKGNEMFLWTLYFPGEDKTVRCSTVNIKGKRWMLKQLMEIFIDKNPEGKFVFESEESWKDELMFKVCGSSVQAKVSIGEVKWKGKILKVNNIEGFKKTGV